MSVQSNLQAGAAAAYLLHFPEVLHDFHSLQTLSSVAVSRVSYSEFTSSCRDASYSEAHSVEEM